MIFISNFLLRFATMAFIAFTLTACGKNEESHPSGTSSTEATIKAYGKKDAECFAGIIKSSDTKHFTPLDFKNWKDKLNPKDKDWLTGFLGFYSPAASVVTTHIGKSPEELFESKLITTQQRNIIEGYLKIINEKDASKASALSASACVDVDFTGLT